MFLVILPASLSCTRNDYSGKVETITIGRNPNETNSLLFIAEAWGLFATNGIQVVFKNYLSGAAAAEGLLKGEVDLATCAEFVTVGKVLKNENIRIITGINKFENVYIVGRIDKGIRSIADLKGKRIGLPRGTSPEFYLGRFLELRGLNIRQVNLVDVSPAQSVEALASGNVDAVAVFQPYPFRIKKKMGDQVVIWPAQSGQMAYFTVIGKDTWLGNHREAVIRLLKSLVQAENYLAGHPEEAKAMVKKRLQYEEAYINTIWGEHRFSVSLDQGLIVAMEDEARWMIRNGLTPEKNMPDFLAHIYIDGLKKVKPAAVNIIR
jgi:NitT/TauT family transport system substrate-binding protein